MPRRLTSWKPARRARSMYSAAGPIARMFVFGGGSNQAAKQQKMHSGLEVREIGNRHQQLPARLQCAKEFRQRARLFFEREVLEDVETQGAIERPSAIGERRQRSASNAFGRVVGIDSFDGQPVRVFVDEHAFAASRVEDAHACRTLSSQPRTASSLAR